MTSVFVDTSGWYALVDKMDRSHAIVMTQITAHRGRLTTSNFVLDETLTLLRYRIGWKVARTFGEKARAGRFVRRVQVTPEDEDAAWEIFVRYHDHAFSFTDCTSFALMQRLRLQVAIALDQDFRTYGLHCLP